VYMMAVCSSRSQQEERSDVNRVVAVVKEDVVLGECYFYDEFIIRLVRLSNKLIYIGASHAYIQPSSILP